MSAALLRTEGLGLRFGGLRAVDGVDYEVAAGEVAAIIGPNGAGKSTLFNLLSGFLRPSEGAVFLGGERIDGLAAHQVARRGIARTFQTTRLFAEASVLDNVLLGHRHRTRTHLLDALLRTRRARREERESRERAREALAVAGVEGLAELPVGSIPQEARKRVAIALALATGPRLLLLDEPAAGVNPAETDGLARLIRAIAARGVTVCLVEHKMRMVMALADRVTVLHHGRKIAEGPPSQVSRDPLVVEAYLGSALHA